MRTAALFLAMVLVPVSATAQEVARSLEQLNRRQVLTAGETVWIVFDFAGAGEYQELKAKLVRVSDTAITVQVDSLPSGTTNLTIDSSSRRPRIEIPERRLRRVQNQRRDPLWKGAIIGGAAGAGLGLLACGECESGGAGIFYGAIFFGAIGAEIDALIKAPPEVVYLGADAPGGLSSRPTLSWFPLVSRERKGLLFTVNW
jgi:hypothetical protein